MSWSLRYSDGALKQLRKMDANQRRILLNWMDKNIEGCENPRNHGKSLTGNLSNVWRYRVGSYRVLCDIQDDNLVVLALKIGHRRGVYQDRI